MKKQTNDEIQVIIGFSVNPEMIAVYNRISEEEKPALQGMTCQLGGTSSNVATALAQMNVKTKLFTLTGYNDDFYTHCLKYALKNSHPKVLSVNFPILEQGHMGFIPVDGIRMNSQVFGSKGKIQIDKLDDCLELIKQEKENIWRVATGVRPSEISLVKALFGEKHRGYRYLNPRMDLIVEKEIFFDLLSKTDILVLNQREYDVCINYQELNSMQDMQKKFGISLIVVTKDKDGGKYFLCNKVTKTREKFEAYLDYSATEIFTTGAGDWFAGAMISSLVKTEKSILEITEAEIKNAIYFAAKVAAKKITIMGAGNGPYEWDL